METKLTFQFDVIKFGIGEFDGVVSFLVDRQNPKAFRFDRIGFNFGEFNDCWIPSEGSRSTGGRYNRFGFDARMF